MTSEKEASEFMDRAPFTLQLKKNIEAFLREEPIVNEIWSEKLRREIEKPIKSGRKRLKKSLRKWKGDHVWCFSISDDLPNPDIVFLPGHCFVSLIDSILTRQGLNGIFGKVLQEVDQGNMRTHFYSAMRGSLMSPRFASICISMGHYILNLWTLWHWYARGMRFPSYGLGFHRDLSLPNFTCLPPEHHPYFATEWRWIGWFLNLVMVLGTGMESDQAETTDATILHELLTIPPCWPQGAVYRDDEPLNKKKIEEDSNWLRFHEKLKSISSEYPFNFSFGGATSDFVSIDVRHILHPDWFQRAMALLAAVEQRLLREIRNILEVWGKLHSSDRLESDKINEELHNAVDWQKNEFAEDFINDAKLNTTAARMTFIQDWSKPEDRKAMEDLNMAMVRMFKKKSGYGPGRRRTTESELTEEIENEIRSLMPELRQILDAVWPIRETHEAEARIKELNLSKLKPNHLHIDAEDFPIQEGQRALFCARFAKNYLLDIKGKNFNSKALKGFLQELLS